MLVARILLGDTTLIANDNKLNRPPNKQYGDLNDLYDSASGRTSDGIIYIICNNF